jgi:K+-sensing histidine kinase KdpD
LVLKIASPLPDAFVKVDKALMQNVIVNILENCAKYKSSKNSDVIVTGERGSNFIKIRIADNGGGVPEDALPKLFDVFYRADPARRTDGNGLGLAISAKIIRRMGGEISAESVPSGGLAIIISLPIPYD